MSKFKPGQSGNPGGRPAGSKHKATLIREALAATFDSGEQGLWRAVAEQAKAGCTASQALIADRLIPKLRPAAEPVAFDLAGEGFTDLARSVLMAVSRGEIDPQTGKALIDAVAGLARVAEIDELKRQLDDLARRVGVAE